MNLTSHLFSFLSSTSSSASGDEKNIIGSLDQSTSEDAFFGKLLDEQTSDFQKPETKTSEETDLIFEDSNLNNKENFSDKYEEINLNEFLDNLELQENLSNGATVIDVSRDMSITDINLNDSIKNSSLDPGKINNLLMTSADKIKPENENNLNISLDIEYIAFDDIHDKLDLNTRENTNHINLQDFLEKIPDKVTSQNDKVTFQNSDLANILNSKGTAGDLLKVNKDPALNEVILLKPLDDFINDKNLKSFDDFLSNDTANYLSIENKGFEGNLILNETIKKHENNSSKLIVGKNISDKNYKNEIDMLSKWSNYLSKNSNLNDETIKIQKSSLDIKTPGNINEDKIALNTFLSLKTDIKGSGKKNPLTNFPYSREFVKGAKYNNDLMIKTLSENDLKFSNPQTFVKDLNIDLENYEIKSSKKEIELSKISLLQPAKHFKNNLNLIRELTSSEIKFVSFKEDGNSLFKDNNISTPSTISEVRQNTQLGQQLTQNTDLTFNASKELQTHLHKQVINQLWKIGQIGQSRAILELEPKELGKVLVTLEMNKGQDGIKVILQTETQQAAQVLQQDASKLRQLYASFGIDLQDFHASKDAGGGNGKSYHDKEKSNVDDKLDTKSIKVKSGVKERNIIGKLDILA